MKKLREKTNEELMNMSDDEIDFSDIPEFSDEFWAAAKVVQPQNKKSLSIRLDNDIVAWFKSQGKGYQSYINNVLRSFVDAQMKKETAQN